MDTFYFGDRGSGKTLRAVIDILIDWYAGREIWSNTPLHSYFDTNYITKSKGNLHLVDAIDLIRLLVDENDNNNNVLTDNPKTLLLDEIKSQASSRNSASFVNRHLANFVSQARKLNFRIIYTDTIIASYDKWLRQMTNKIVSCHPIQDKNDLGLGDIEYPEPLFFGYAEIDIDKHDLKPRTYWISRNTARAFYPLYDTKKRIAPIELKYQSDKE